MALGLAVVTAACAAACGGGNGPGKPGGGAGGSSASNGSGNGGFSFSSSSGATQGFDVEPSALQTLTVAAGQMTPTVAYMATLDGVPVNAGWAVDQGNIGSIPAAPASTAVFTPSGTTGGTVTIQAGYNGKTVTRQVLVELASTQNGPTAGEQGQIPTTVGQLTSGGGVGGVGGEGLGPAVTNMGTLTALGAPGSNGAAQGLAFLYPYDKTVFPRGLLAPLLMWTWSIGDADAIQIQLKTTTGSFSWTGTFGRPAILAMETPPGSYVRAPIPQDVWAMATNTAGGADQLTVSLTVAKGGVGYGPISETWTIAPAHLDGTIYYNSYGTALTQNSCCRINSTTEMFGAPALSIHVGDTAPKVVAGDSTECRVCHSVAANGSRLVIQQSDYNTRSDYELTPNGATEITLTHTGSWYPAVYPDGSRMLTPDGLLLPLPNDATPLPTSGLPTDPETPAFSPDGTLVAFNPGSGSKLTVMSFAVATGAFSGETTVVDDTGTMLTPAWPAFFPDSKSMVFHHQSYAGTDTSGNDPVTRGGALAQIHWTSAADSTGVTPLDNLNGKGYLPKLAAPSTVPCRDDYNSVVGTGWDSDHSDDVDHNYEPTVNPAPSGGYVWVVFTSRRMYGSVANISPFCSDPRYVDLLANVTPKKLWVAAIDLDQAAGKDSSHPAFYLPGQELYAGNSRGFWVLDPCRADGASCTSGDQCCNGYCEAAGDGGALVCSNAPPGNTCSATGDKCTTSADCCDMTNACINGFCTLEAPQ